MMAPKVMCRTHTILLLVLGAGAGLQRGHMAEAHRLSHSQDVLGRLHGIV